jgi:hypothetical protein
MCLHNKMGISNLFKSVGKFVGKKKTPLRKQIGRPITAPPKIQPPRPSYKPPLPPPPKYTPKVPPPTKAQINQARRQLTPRFGGVKVAARKTRVGTGRALRSKTARRTTGLGANAALIGAGIASLVGDAGENTKQKQEDLSGPSVRDSRFQPKSREYSYGDNQTRFIPERSSGYRHPKRRKVCYYY